MGIPAPGRGGPCRCREAARHGLFRRTRGSGRLTTLNSALVIIYRQKDNHAYHAARAAGTDPAAPAGPAPVTTAERR
jgi:hypothetical protein